MNVGTVRGMIFDIQRFSIHDGPGIRTTVFMKGCPLRCLWCHNPEGTSIEPGLSFLPDRCIGCGYCFRACPRSGHRMEDGKHILVRDECVVCGSCTEECYAGALEYIGREATVDEVLETVMRDQPFYETSGGGVTLSGGEPMMQIEFTEAILTESKARGLHTCVETSGHTQYEYIERIGSLVDLFLYDVKEMDNDRHIEYTGVPNTLLLANLQRLHDSGAAILIRVPMIPGLNDRPDNFQGLANLAARLPHIQGIELLPYHPLGVSKRERLGMEPDVSRPVSPDDAMVAGWIRTLRDLGANVINTIPVSQSTR